MRRDCFWWTVLVGLAVLELALCGITPGPNSCPAGTKHCKRKGNPICLREEYLCNGVTDCDDVSDERNCTACKSGAFVCDGVCARATVRCDGVQHCRDGADEFGCGGIPANLQRYRLLWTCKDGTTRRKSARCDSVFDCPEKEDELNCSADKCQGGSFWCDGRCLHGSNWCDGWARCSDGMDEVDCPEGGFDLV